MNYARNRPTGPRPTREERRIYRNLTDLTRRARLSDKYGQMDRVNHERTREVTESGNILPDDFIIRVRHLTAAISLRLPSAKLRPGKRFRVEDADGKCDSLWTITIYALSEGNEEFIKSGQSGSNYVMNRAYENVVLRSDGRNWYVEQVGAAQAI